MGMYRLKQRMTLTAAAAVLVPLTAACGSERAEGGSSAAGADKPPVTGVHWSVDSVTAGGRTHPAPADAHLRIGADGRAEGSLGCNRFGARATVDGDRVRLTDVTATEMGCDDTPAGFEETLARALTAGPLTAEADGDRLTLTTAGGDTVRLSEWRAGDASPHGTR